MKKREQLLKILEEYYALRDDVAPRQLAQEFVEELDKEYKDISEVFSGFLAFVGIISVIATALAWFLILK